MSRALARLRGLLAAAVALARGGEPSDREMEEEMRFHVDMATERNVRRGLPPGEARRRALAQFGGVERFKAEAKDDRPGRGLDALAHDLHSALRGLRARPGLTGVVALTMALGIGANTVMFGVLDRLLLRPPAHVREPERVFTLGTRRAGEDWTQTTFSYAAFRELRTRVPAFAAVAAYTPGADHFPLGHGASASRARGALVSASFFSTLGARPALGRFFLPEDDREDAPRPAAVVSWGFWRRHFGGRPDALGRTLDIGTQRYTVVGVAPREFTGVELATVDVWLPVGAARGLRFDRTPDWTNSYGATWLAVVARLGPGVTPAAAAAQATAAHRQILELQVAANPKMRRWTRPERERAELLTVMPGAPADDWGGVAKRDIGVSRLLGGVAFLVLLIACANVANLLLLRAVDRRREIAVRLALGASRARLVRQLVLEGVLLSGAGGAGALLLAALLAPVVHQLLLGGDAWAGGGVDARVFAFTAVVAMLTGVAASLAPALRGSRLDLTSALRQGARDGGGRRSRLRTGLLVLQAALAVVLVAGAGLFLRSLRNVAAQPYGFDVDRVLTAKVDEGAAGLTNAEAERTYHDFLERVRAVPGVRGAAVSLGLPFGMSWMTQVFEPGRAEATKPATKHSLVQYAVTPGYFQAMGIRLVAGRALADADRMGTEPVALVNETMARLFWPGASALGRCIKVEADTVPCATVVGVVTNTRRQSIREGLVAQVYRPLAQLPPAVTESSVSFFGYQLVVGTDGPATREVEPVRRALQSVSASAPYVEVTPMSRRIGEHARSWRLGATVLTAFGGLALALASMGLYSVLAFALAQRLHEFGIRLALGARPAHLLALTLLRGLAPLAAGVACGVALALLGGRWVGALLFDVSPRDPVVLAGAGLLLLAVGALASVIPARRAARVDPARVLRTD